MLTLQFDLINLQEISRFKATSSCGNVGKVIGIKENKLFIDDVSMEIFVPAITQFHERFQEPELKGANHEEGAMI